MTALAPVLQAFFTDRLIAQRRASPHTIAGYRTTFRLLIRFATTTTGQTPSALDIADLDVPLITAFLNHLEVDRHNTVRRLEGIRAGGELAVSAKMLNRV